MPGSTDQSAAPTKVLACAAAPLHTQHRDARVPNDRIATAIGPQVAAARQVPDDQKVTLRLFCRSVQQLMNVSAINDHLGIGVCISLKLGDLLSGVADEHLFPFGNDMEPPGP